MWALFALPWVRKLAGFLLLLAAIGAAVLGVYHAGRRAGSQAEAGKEVEAAKAQFVELKTNFQQQLDAGHQRETELRQMAQNFANLAAAAQTRVDTARHGSELDAAKVKALPDSAVKADLEQKAGGPLEDLPVLRRIDDVFTDYPHKLDELKATRDGLAAVNSRVDAVTAQVGNMTAERDSAIAAFNQLTGLYTQAYNAAIQGHRRWYCAFVCKPKNKINLPDPVSVTSSLKRGTK